MTTAGGRLDRGRTGGEARSAASIARKRSRRQFPRPSVVAQEMLSLGSSWTLQLLGREGPSNRAGLTRGGRPELTRTMARFVRWVCLIVGMALLADVGAVLAEFARVAAPFGGIPWSWNLLIINIRWVAMAMVGVLLTALSAYLFVKARRRIEREKLPVRRA